MKSTAMWILAGAGLTWLVYVLAEMLSELRAIRRRLDQPDDKNL